jgi:hypothetical protein
MRHKKVARSTREAFGHPGPAIERPKPSSYGDRVVGIMTVIGIIIAVAILLTDLGQ